jgi:pyruvate dehydrogenase E2 component (dihydrolipoamide acetyltransferase)
VARELTMPKLSDSMADAVILRWLKSPGEAFARGEALIEVETDKATVVYEAETDGTLGSILTPEGTTVAVGDPIATLDGGDGTPDGRRKDAEGLVAAPPPAPAAPESGPAPVAPAAVEPADGRPNATPVARRIAVELGVSLHGLAGTGPGGRITREDVERAAATGTGMGTEEVPAPPAPATAGGRGDARVLELTPTQATIARRMVESATTIPVFTASADVDMSLVVALRRGARDEGGDAPSVNDFVVKAAALALREFPRLNASWAAVATNDALLVPVVTDADRRSLGEIAAETRRLADLARRRALGLDALRDGTFTVSNLGMYGLRSFTAIIDPPQTAILAVGGVRREPVEDAAGAVGLRDVMTVTLTCDHRVVYGAHAAEFLARLRELLQRPLALVEGER